MNKISVFIAGETSSTIKKKVGPKKNWYLDVLCADSYVSFYDIYKNLSRYLLFRTPFGSICFFIFKKSLNFG